ncbi:hypothetical protein AZE42_11242 [Rhizopogon vesiculosus]|uniref:Uncharacterized protein n=1 Tax=Rhizopogon vesiculosus TaxID=180088 RepID=A0A1J8QTV3_9AGAM|nr:hypothetical protein AZE42_11242 [Rhizopogon vesiculosus]
MSENVTFKPALALIFPRDEPSNTLQTPSSIIDLLEEGEITEEDVSSTTSTSVPPKITFPLLKISSGTLRVPSESESAQSSRLSSPAISCGSTMTATPTIPQYSELDTRPMTREDLDHAKDLVLDLLGWGVSPQYLIEAGVSMGILHRVFTELNLRLPTNLVLASTWPSSTISG